MAFAHAVPSTWIALHAQLQQVGTLCHRSLLEHSVQNQGSSASIVPHPAQGPGLFQSGLCWNHHTTPSFPGPSREPVLTEGLNDQTKKAKQRNCPQGTERGTLPSGRPCSVCLTSSSLEKLREMAHYWMALKGLTHPGRETAQPSLPYYPNKNMHVCTHIHILPASLPKHTHTHPPYSSTHTHTHTHTQR